MFPLQPSDELVFRTPTTSQRDQIGDDLIVDHALMESKYISFSTSTNDRQLGQTKNLWFQQRQTERRYECNIRKIMHRDIEKKRRQEMSKLYVSLRSLLPLEHIKGKRTVSDQMQEAVNYIKQMQKNIQELRIRRDKLKKFSKLSGTTVESSNGSDNLPNSVTVNLVPDGMEILISRSIKSSDLGISRVLAELVERELDVVSCVSTRTKGGFLHKIQIEARDMTSLDASVQQDRLISAIKNLRACVWE